ncbi:hypothetical protein Dsin_022279 [Dipteronia sinensis]|uniref:Uncharacterized protein n=1 Tax=Dipteronia sinensis TaxID=43782 RepID=A0AAE0DZX2_9ROSI|nr:hypothetical protein Dsin_022279 [Dipteronia sinensis]
MIVIDNAVAVVPCLSCTCQFQSSSTEPKFPVSKFKSRLVLVSNNVIGTIENTHNISTPTIEIIVTCVEATNFNSRTKQRLQFQPKIFRVSVLPVFERMINLARLQHATSGEQALSVVKSQNQFGEQASDSPLNL